MTRPHPTPPTPDPAALVALLRLWVVGIVVWLGETLGDGPLGRALLGWTMRMLDRAERGAGALAVRAAVARLRPPPPVLSLRSLRPGSAPRGFAHVRVRGNDMRRMTRRLFPRERDPVARAERLGRFLDALDRVAARLSRRIARVLPTHRIALVAPPAAACVACAPAVAPATPDSS